MSYPVGTICVGQNLTEESEWNGMECVIISPAEYCRLRGARTGQIRYAVAYEVRWADGDVSWQEHFQLKPKRDYDEDKRAEDRKKVRDLYNALEAEVKRDREKVSESVSAAWKVIEAEAKQ